MGLLVLPRGEELRKYLGVPILHKRVNKQTYQIVINKWLRRCLTWDAQSLSLAGCLTFVQSIMATIPMCTMQSTSSSGDTIKKIERICHTFLWASNNGKRKASIVKWSQVCLPKEMGGLVLHHLHECNDDFLMKLGFNIITKPKELWVRILCAKCKRLFWFAFGD